MKLRTMTAICMELLGGFKHRDIANKYGVSPSTVSIFKHRLEKKDSIRVLMDAEPCLN